MEKFQNTVDDLILRSNVCKCHTSIPADEKKQKKERRGCINKHGNCKVQFPRQTFEKTKVDPKTGALNIKKGEKWINTLTPIVTWGSGPLLHMACTSLIRFNWFLSKITQINYFFPQGCQL